MKSILTILALALPGGAFAQDVNGLWQTETSDSGAYLHVRIGDCSGGNGQKCGQIVEVFNSDNQSIKGKPIIWAMQPDGAGRWSGGRIWAPDDDKTYRSKMRLNGNTLSVEGCVTIICRGQDWKRIQ
jgi:uncharacterized protein (DUF2147 family)